MSGKVSLFPFSSRQEERARSAHRFWFKLLTASRKIGRDLITMYQCEEEYPEDVEGEEALREQERAEYDRRANSAYRATPPQPGSALIHGVGEFRDSTIDHEEEYDQDVEDEAALYEIERAEYARAALQHRGSGGSAGEAHKSTADVFRSAPDDYNDPVASSCSLNANGLSDTDLMIVNDVNDVVIRNGLGRELLRPSVHPADIAASGSPGTGSASEQERSPALLTDHCPFQLQN